MSTLKEAMDKLGITVISEFVPYSLSRNANPGAHPKDMSLNWKVTLLKDGREILTTDYTAGIGHCPSYQPFKGWTADYINAIRHECERGFKRGAFRQKILPKPEDVVYSLAMGSGVIDYAKFEDWADEYGYDSDSRKAEATYKDCLSLALQLRNGLGDAALKELQEATQGY